jgi:toxin-antitoxin system PIN domain toxin
MIVDVNVLLYAVNEDAPFHQEALDWLTWAYNSQTRIGLSWAALTGFLRISTNPRVFEHPLTPEQAWQCIDLWLGMPQTWIPEPGPGHGKILRDLMTTTHVAANLVSDAHLAALAIENGVAVSSFDTDFARFPVTWENPGQIDAARES